MKTVAMPIEICFISNEWILKEQFLHIILSQFTKYYTKCN